MSQRCWHRGRAAKPARAARFTLDAPEHSGTIPGARGDILTPGVALTSNLAVIFTLNQHSQAEHDAKINVIFEAIRKLIEPPPLCANIGETLRPLKLV